MAIVNKWTPIHLQTQFEKPSSYPLSSGNHLRCHQWKRKLSRWTVYCLVLTLSLNSFVSVEQCLKMCGLEHHADAIVGSLGVEHRKRTTIAVELAAKVSSRRSRRVITAETVFKPKLLLFLDEPTSGLDSQSAWAIVRFLRTLAQSGQAILCT